MAANAQRGTRAAMPSIAPAQQNLAARSPEENVIALLDDVLPAYLRLIASDSVFEDYL
jgi:hypothetical protein